MGIHSSITRTHDLNLAAALITSGFKTTSMDRDRRGRFYFVFNQTDKLTVAVNKYWSDELIVDARIFAENIKMLKGRIYAED